MHEELLRNLLGLYGKVDGSGKAITIVTAIKRGYPEAAQFVAELAKDCLPGFEEELCQLAGAPEAERSKFVTEFWDRAHTGEPGRLAYPSVFAQLQELRLTDLEASEVIQTAGPDGAIGALEWIRDSLQTLLKRGEDPQASADALHTLLAGLRERVRPGENTRTIGILTALGLQIPKECKVLPTVVLYAAYELLEAAKQHLIDELARALGA